MEGCSSHEATDLEDSVELGFEGPRLIAWQTSKENTLEFELTEGQSQVLRQLLKVPLQHCLEKCRAQLVNT